VRIDREHLLGLVLHHRQAAATAVFVAQKFEDSLGGVPLLGRRRSVSFHAKFLAAECYARWQAMAEVDCA
jgi:hypothetical protein